MTATVTVTVSVDDRFLAERDPEILLRRLEYGADNGVRWIEGVIGVQSESTFLPRNDPGVGEKG